MPCITDTDALHDPAERAVDLDEVQLGHAQALAIERARKALQQLAYALGVDAGFDAGLLARGLLEQLDQIEDAAKLDQVAINERDRALEGDE